MVPLPQLLSFHTGAMGSFHHFTGLINSRQLKCCRYITEVEGGLVTIVDEHTFVEVSNKLSSVEVANIRPKFNIDRAELEVTASQGPSLPARDKVHPLMGWWVIFRHNHTGASQKLQRCHLRNWKHFSYHRTPSSIYLFCLTTPSISITLFQTDVHALCIGQRITDHFSLGQKRRWLPYISQIISHALHHLDLRMLHHGHWHPNHQEVSHPLMSYICKLTHTGHWIFTPSVQCLIEQKTIVFSFCNLHEASNKFQGYTRCMGRTLPMDCCCYVLTGTHCSAWA